MGPIAAEVAVWLPGLFAREFVGQNSIVMYGLATYTCQYIQSLCTIIATCL